MSHTVFEIVMACEALYASEVSYVSAQMDMYTMMGVRDPRAYEQLREASRRLVHVGLRLRGALKDIRRLMDEEESWISGRPARKCEM